MCRLLFERLTALFQIEIANPQCFIWLVYNLGICDAGACLVRGGGCMPLIHLAASWSYPTLPVDHYAGVLKSDLAPRGCWRAWREVANSLAIPASARAASPSRPRARRRGDPPSRRGDSEGGDAGGGDGVRVMAALNACASRVMLFATGDGEGSWPNCANKGRPRPRLKTCGE